MTDVTLWHRVTRPTVHDLLRIVRRPSGWAVDRSSVRRSPLLLACGYHVTGSSTLAAMSEPSARDGRNRYLALVAVVVVVAVAGSVGYVLYPRFDLPAVEGAGLLGLAAGAGVASFFSPCSFPLLVTLLDRQAVADSESGRPARPAVFGGSLALGAATFMLSAGAIIAWGGEALFARVTFTSTAGITIRVVIGFLLILLGLIQIGALPLSMHSVSQAAQPLLKRQAGLRRDRPVMGFAVFGFGYVLAGFG